MTNPTPDVAELIERLERHGAPPTLPSACNELTNEAAAALRELSYARDSLRFELQGLEHMRFKDNEYLLTRAEKAKAELADLQAKARAVVNLRRGLNEFEDPYQYVIDALAAALPKESE